MQFETSYLQQVVSGNLAKWFY